MSDTVFPNLPGMVRIGASRDSIYRTEVFETLGGAEQRISWRSTSRRPFRIVCPVLRDDVAAPAPWSPYSELGALLWFWDQHRGAGQSFLWDDPDARKNLLAYSQDFSQSAWYKAGITVTPDAVAAPDGTTTADQLASTGVDAAITGSFTPAAIVAHALSIWLRAATPRTVNLYFLRNSPFAVISSIAASVVMTWTPFSLPGTVLDLTSHGFQIGGGSTLPIGATIFAWGAQAEPASSAGLYVPTGASAETGRYRVRFKDDSLSIEKIGSHWYQASFDLVTVAA